MDLTRLADRQLLDRQRALAAERRRVDGELAAVAAEIAHRSRRELGSAGLAQRLGLRTPQKLIEHVAQVSPHDANVLVRVGEVTGPVADAVATGELGLDAADAIRAIDTPELEEQLIAEAATLPPRRVAVRARQLRDEADAAGVAEREALLRSRRYLHLTPQPDGMTRIAGLLDPESAAIVTAAYDGVTSPRRGGVRFTDPDPDTPPAPDPADDDRTLDQVALDGLVELIRIGSTAGSEKVLGANRPAVRVHVTAEDLHRGDGAAGAFEGQTVPASIATVQRQICATGYIPILFDHEHRPLDVGRSQRLFTTRQRIALAARDGGCLFPHCDRPPTWCEAHHITPWRHGGTTDTRDGVLLCRHHHLLVHNNGWRIARNGADYHLIPPPDIDPSQAPIPLPSKAPVRTAA
jgi:hypothetical protein